GVAPAPIHGLRCRAPSHLRSTVASPRATLINNVLILRGGLSRRGRHRLGLLVADHLTAGVGAARRADAVWQAWAVAARALVQPRSRDLVLGAPLVAPRPRLSLLGDRHWRGMVAATRPLHFGSGGRSPVYARARDSATRLVKRTALVAAI